MTASNTTNLTAGSIENGALVEENSTCVISPEDQPFQGE
jgi:hypothetical protein